jgi:O-antigen/teichoic acid export membrane protein
MLARAARREMLLGRAARMRGIWREIAWIIAGEAVGAVGSIVAVRILTSALNPVEYGLLALGSTIATLLGQVLLGPLANGFERFFAAADEHRRLPELFWSVRRLTAAASAIGLAAGAFVTVGLSVTGHAEWETLAAGGFIYALISGWERIVDGLQNAARARAIVAWHQALRQWLRPVVALLLLGVIAQTGAVALAGFGAASALVLVSQLTLARGRFASTSRHDFDSAVARAELVRVLRYSAPFTIWGIFSWLQLSSDRWALQILGTAHDVGLYAVVWQLGLYPITLAGTVLSQLSAPIVFARVGDGHDSARLRESLRMTWALVASFVALSAVAVVGAWALNRPLFELLVASDYRQASGLLPIAVAAGAAFSVGQILCLLPMAAGRSSVLIPPKIGTAILSVALYFLGAWQGGIQGILIASVLVAGVYVAWTAGVALQITRHAGLTV